MRNERGAILFLVIIFSFILAALGMTVIYMHGMEEIYVKSELASARARLMSESGISRAREWLTQYSEQYLENSLGTSARLPFGEKVVLEPGNSVEEGWYKVTVTPQSPPSQVDGKEYRVVSEGYAGGVKKTITTAVWASSPTFVRPDYSVSDVTVSYRTMWWREGPIVRLN